MTRPSSKSALLPTITMGTFSSSLIRIISSRRLSNSLNDEGDVMLKTSRKPWPVFIYKSLMATTLELVGNAVGEEGRDFIPNCSVPAVSRLLSQDQ